MAVRPASPVVILLDIETSPNLSWTWGRYEQDVIRFEREWQLLSFAYKEAGKGKTVCVARPDFKDKGDRAITKAAWELLNRADVVIGHNLDKFDNRKLRAKFVEHGLQPPKPYKTIDTLKIARSQFAFNSNRLDDLGATLKVGRKAKTGGVELWFQCMEGNAKAWRKMRRYNSQDVDLLEAIYDRLKSWYPSHPNLALYEGRPGCPVCKSLRVQRRGFNVMRASVSARYQCREPLCAHWFSGKIKAA